MNIFRKWMTLLFSIVALSLAGCGDSDKFYGEPGAGTIDPTASYTLSATPSLNTITVNTTTTINIGVLQDGLPVDGVQVALLAESGNFGGAKVTTATTLDGIATVTLTAAKKVGTDTITVTLADSSVTIPMSYLVGPVDPTKVFIGAADPLVGVSTATTITAQIYDAFYNEVTGYDLEFTVGGTSGGQLELVTYKQTDSSGSAQIQYTSGSAGLDTISVLDASNAGALLGTADVTVNATAANISSIVLSQAQPSTFMLVGTTQVLTAEVYDTNSALVGDNVPVTFQVANAGRLDEDPADAATALAPIITVYTVAGRATVILNAPTLVSSDTITASTGGASGTLSLDYRADAPAAVNVVIPVNSIGSRTDTIIEATVLDKYDNPIAGETVDFTTSGAGFFTPLSASALSDANGLATITYNSGDPATLPVNDTITATSRTVSSATGTNIVTVASSSAGGQVPDSMIIQRDQASVLSDGSDFATITVTVLDQANVAVPDATVNFTADSGALSAGQVVTDATGRAVVTIRATAGTSAQTITVSATNVDILDPVTSLPQAVTMPIDVVGSTVSVVLDKSQLLSDDATQNSALVTVTVTDASGGGISSVALTLSVNPAVGSLTATSGTTDSLGVFTTTLTAVADGTDTLSVDAAGLVGSSSYSVSSTTGSLQFDTLFLPSGTSVQLGVSRDVKVDMPAGVTTATLVSTVGKWVSSNASSVQVTNPSAPAAGSVIESISSIEGGLATIRVTDDANTSVFDEIQLLFVDEIVTDKSTVSIQASPSTVAPSFGSTLNSSELIIHVTNTNGTGIANAMVVLTMTNTTNSGEYISPAVVYTDSSGSATATFYSGTASSSGNGVEVSATLDTNATAPAIVSDMVPIIVGGTAGSVSINVSTTVEHINLDTMYRLPISVMVTDSAGNPVANTGVTLNLWPEKYGLGYWFCKPQPGFVRFVDLPNEDINKDQINDPGEDVSLNGELTPQLADAGTVPTLVTTDDSGVALFTLDYGKRRAQFIYNALSATTTVAGTETRATKRFWLGASQSDISACVLGASPYNEHWASMSAAAFPSTVNTGGTSTVTVELLDTTGVPVSGQTIIASVSVPETTDTIAPTIVAEVAGSDVTNGSGIATFTYTAGDKAGSDVVSFRYQNGPAIIEIFLQIDVI